MKYLVITTRTPGFDPEVLPAHYQFLGQLRDGGVLEQAGGFTDRSGGAYVLAVASLAEAEGIANRDPLHVCSCSELSVHEWDAS